MHECVHADNQLRYVRITRQDGTKHYSIQCANCGTLVRTNRHGGKLLIKHSDIPSGQPVFDLGSAQ